MQPMMTDPMQQYDPATQALIAGQTSPQPQGMSSSPSAAGQGMGSIAKIAQQLMMMKAMNQSGPTPGSPSPLPDPVMGTGYSGQVSPTTQAGSLSSWFNSNPTFGR